MSAKSKIAAAVAVGALLLMANEASAQHRAAVSHNSMRHVPHVFGRAYGFVPRPAPPSGPGGGAYFSNSQGHQPYPNPDRDYSIQNLSSHPSG